MKWWSQLQYMRQRHIENCLFLQTWTHGKNNSYLQFRSALNFTVPRTWTVANSSYHRPGIYAAQRIQQKFDKKFLRIELQCVTKAAELIALVTFLVANSEVDVGNKDLIRTDSPLKFRGSSMNLRLEMAEAPPCLHMASRCSVLFELLYNEVEIW